MAHEPWKARATILAAFTGNKGNAVHTAKALDVGLTTLKRWVAELESKGYSLNEEIQKLRTDDGNQDLAATG